MEIREQLARRFYLRVHRGGNMPGLIDDWSTVQDKWRWEVMADECLRQMEWVRHDYLMKRIAEGRHDAPRWAYEVYESVRDGDITLAPDDWTP